MNSWERMSEEKRILYGKCDRMWWPVFFCSFLVYAAIGYLLALLSGGGEYVATAYAIIAMVLAAGTPLVTDAIYFEIQDRAIMKRYREGMAQEEKAANG